MVPPVRTTKTEGYGGNEQMKCNTFGRRKPKAAGFASCRGHLSRGDRLRLGALIVAYRQPITKEPQGG